MQSRIHLGAASILAILCFPSLTSAQCIAPPEGLIAWWPGDGNAQDIALGHDGVPLNGASFDTGMVDQAFRFDGQDDEISIPDDPDFTLGDGPFTIDLWVLFDQVVGRDPFIGHDENGGEFNKWIFWYDESGHDTPSGPALRFHINSPTLPPHDSISVPWFPVPNVWYHVAVTRDGDLYTLYIDGAPVGTSIDTVTIPDPDFPVTIGRAEGFHHEGLIDEVEFFDRALSAAEIQSIFDAGSDGKCKCDSIVTADVDQAGIVIAPGTDVSGTVLQDLGVHLSGISDSGTPGVFTNVPGPPGTDTDDLLPISGNYLTTLDDPTDLFGSDSGTLCVDFVDPLTHFPRTVEFFQVFFLDVEASIGVVTAFAGRQCTGDVLFQADTGPGDPDRSGSQIPVQVGELGSGSQIASVQIQFGQEFDSAAVDHFCFRYTTSGLSLDADDGFETPMEIQPGSDFAIPIRASNDTPSRFPGTFLTFVIRRPDDPYRHRVILLRQQNFALPSLASVSAELTYTLPSSWGARHSGERLRFVQTICSRDLFVQARSELETIIVP